MHISTNFAANILHEFKFIYYIMICFQVAVCLRAGDGLCSRCRRNTEKQHSYFRPIASVRLFYKMFAYMILHRIEPCLDSHQPKEQHGFHAGRRLEEHLLTANLLLDKTLAANSPVVILSLDLSQAFDRVDWGVLWLALRTRGVNSYVTDSSRPIFWSPW